ncbi:MAG: peptide chain release factor-like protein [Candidatus Margulisiibacteriota bacterium]
MSHITNQKWSQLRENMAMLGIIEDEISESFILGSGSGGQKLNKTHSTVVLKYKSHQIRCKKSRSRDGNRYFARKMLCEIISNELGFPTRDQIKIQKAIKQKKRRKRKSEIKYTSGT